MCLWIGDYVLYWRMKNIKIVLIVLALVGLVLA